MPPEKPKRVTAHAEKLQRALEGSRNKWLTRLEIAHAVGKKRLTPYDIVLLEFLADQNLIRMQQEDGFSREGYRWVYGVFDDDTKAEES